jgi:hypothetical protein
VAILATPAEAALRPPDLSDVEALAEELADQRLFLAELIQRFAVTQEAWQRDREAVLLELETAGESLSRREQVLEQAEEERRRHDQENAQLRRYLESWQAQLTVETAEWKAQRALLMDDVRGQVEMLAEQQHAVALVREQWQARQQEELERLRASLDMCEGLRREWAVLRMEGMRQTARLEQAQRAVAEKALALEQYRQECISQSSNPRAAERRLRRLRRHWANLASVAVRRIARERESLQAQAAGLAEQESQMTRRLDAVAAAETDLANRQTEWESVRLAVDVEQRKLRSETQIARHRAERYEQQVRELRDEIERLAGWLVVEVDAATPQMEKAA